MAETRTRWPTEAENQRIQAIINRHDTEFERPDGVRRVAFNFGEDQAGNPALHLELFVSRDMQPTRDKIEELNDFVQVIIDDILEKDVDYWPYARTLIEE